MLRQTAVETSLLHTDGWKKDDGDHSHTKYPQGCYILIGL